MASKLFISAKEVAKELEVSDSYAYRLIRQLNNADGSLISIDVMKKEYPGTYQYLEDCYELLVPKCLNGGKGRDIKNATADTWYQYGRTQAITAFVNTPKLIVRILSKDPMYA